MADVLYAQSAQTDMLEAWLFIAEENMEAADRASRYFVCCTMRVTSGGLHSEFSAARLWGGQLKLRACARRAAPSQAGAFRIWIRPFFQFDQLSGEPTVQIVVNVPNALLDALQSTQIAFEQEAKLAMAVKLFEMKRLSSGMAATLVGMDRVTFLAALQRFAVPVFDLEPDELSADVTNA
ncbi:MAG: UPF0175 family protein [Hydrogenophaga sp.]|jgi:predicted HTH domain antitoxin|uniref:UPF0175 family protein n=1 Tax=Hydrogenophaga sp. TaxID=1904254 RepID=UPI002790912A|nr:UPF0175 family protein [Hydrogenophaga sp.]MDP3132676.1 UPF0175 family protein [Burkholderiaceae bacterium]MDZ4190142.1 UPF0175 family protein [Hydrogenophaga sp.]